jgi:hypothetical protein
MRTLRNICILIVMAMFATTVATAAETNFTASSLTAENVDCKKCHTDTPHVIHAQKAVDCVACHGDKLTVAIPQCTKCHNGPIHQVHAGKVNTQACSYCHKTITEVHNNLMSDAVCSHCHKDLVIVHGQDQSCIKCHRSPPEIVKPLKLEGTVLICQNCHPAPSVATIHAPPTDKIGCYNCHKGTSKSEGSEVPHVIHATLVDCKGCHEENGKVVVPDCTRCHQIDTLHDFNKIGKLTPQSGLNCQACHPTEAKSSSPMPTAQPAETAQVIETTQEPAKGPVETGPFGKIPGFEIMLALGILLTGYILVRKQR